MIGLIGTFNSGLREARHPGANRASNGPVAMVSPSNTYPGLTEGGPGTEAGEPDNYYPTGTRNYARVVWNDQFQGAANAQYAKELGLKKVFVLNDSETYGLGIATLFINVREEARHRDLSATRSGTRRPRATSRSPAASRRPAPTRSSSAASSATTAAS